MSFTKRNTLGFTLVELLAAVAVVGVLATVAIPKYRAYIARSRSAEAKVNLGTILSLERSYFYEYDDHAPDASYGNCEIDNCQDADKKNALGFRAANCQELRYRYTSMGGSDFGANANSTKCEIYPGCDTAERDLWNIDEAGALTHVENIIEKCTQ